MKLTKVALAVLALGIGSAQAAEADRIAQLEAQMKLLQEQLAAGGLLYDFTVNLLQHPP